MSEYPLMVGLGEILWDLLPLGRVLGGAPANFAYMASILGNEGVIASRVGMDELGREASQVMHTHGLSTSYLQEDGMHATGSAAIVLDAGGQPRFTIKESVAWDFLEWTPSWKQLAMRADVVCFGSLAQRSPSSALTIDCFLQNLSERAIRICDANLREPFYTPETLRKSFQRAQILKVNCDELLQIASLMNVDNVQEVAIARRLINEFDLELVCITRGEKGSMLVSDSCAIEHPGFNVKVADAVGSGDAFTACLAHYYLRGATLDEISERANRLGAWVATQRGATPLVQHAQLLEIFEGRAFE